MKKLLGVAMFLFSSLSADEGMWPFHALPINEIKERYAVELEAPWIEHIQKSCVRLSSGGSGSFVSKNGLVLTNHHVGESAIYHLSTKRHDLIKNGFLAQNKIQELKCPNLYVDRLMEVRDITNEVNQKISGENFKEKEKMRKALFSQMKKRAQEETGLQPEVVLLYRGAKIFLYLYERFSDVRLVMAPEKEVASFGGDPENFEYPRTAFDFCFFRVYKEGKPLETENFLKWSRGGPKTEEPLFVAGHPGGTSRMLTSAHLRFAKDYSIANRRKWLQERKDRLEAFSKENAENERIALSDFGSLENTLKVLNSYTDERLDAIIGKKKETEASLDQEVLARLTKALIDAETYWKSYLLLESGYTSKLYAWAKTLVRFSEEISKPNEERLQEYGDSELKTMQLDLFSEEPIYKELERITLRDFFDRTISELGPQHPVAQLLAKADVEELVAKTELNKLGVRKKLYEEVSLIKGSDDPLIRLARAIDPYARAVRQQKEDGLDGVQNEVYTKLAEDKFKRWGDSVYPDATFTLRLSFGAMRSYEEKGKILQPMTQIGSLFEKAKLHDFKAPYSLPKRWLKREENVNQKIPLNFVSTNDIIGGNSGSPVINRKGELVGLIFDGNCYSNLWQFGYSDVQGRAISVHSSGILDALEQVYKAKSLVSEIIRVCR